MPIVDVPSLLLSTSYDGVLDCSRSLPKTNPEVSVTVLTVSGELDACTGGQLARDLRCCVVIGRPIIIDLSMIDFFGTAGLHVLIDFDRECRARGLAWVMVSAPIVDRMAGLTGATDRLRGVGSLRAARWRLRGALIRSSRQTAPLADPAVLQC